MCTASQVSLAIQLPHVIDVDLLLLEAIASKTAANPSTCLTAPSQVQVTAASVVDEHDDDDVDDEDDAALLAAQALSLGHKETTDDKRFSASLTRALRRSLEDM